MLDPTLHTGQAGDHSIATASGSGDGNDRHSFQATLPSPGRFTSAQSITKGFECFGRLSPIDWGDQDQAIRFQATPVQSLEIIFYLTKMVI
jgi:hypothetical protein